MNTRTLANFNENQELIKKYRKSNNTIQVFLEDEENIKDIFASGNKVPRNVMYGKYVAWCTKYNYFVRKRNDFYEQVLSSKDYRECSLDGNACIENLSVKKEGLKEKPTTF